MMTSIFTDLIGSYYPGAGFSFPFIYFSTFLGPVKDEVLFLKKFSLVELDS